MSKNQRQIAILGIESSCDETAAAVVVNGRKILSNIVSSQIDIHKLYGGVVPEVASRNHVAVIDKVVAQALEQAELTLDDIDAIAVTKGGGLIGALFVGMSYAKGLSMAANIPLIATSHTEGHICANFLTHQALEPPFLCILASGGHTAIVLVCDFDNFTVLASTVDDAAGEAFDKVARVLGLAYPGGVYLDKLSWDGQNTIKLPSVLLKDGNFSYSGLKTAVTNYIHNAQQKGESIVPCDIAKSFSHAAVDGLVNSAVHHAKKHGINKIAASGGVAANSLLRQKLQELQSQNYQIFVPQLALCGDNAAMIASRGYFHFLKKEFSTLDVTSQAREDNWKKGQV